MFNSHVFQSWPSILAGALLFALLFTIVGSMSELVLEGVLRITNKVLSLSFLAFVGYIVVALMIRQREF